MSCHDSIKAARTASLDRSLQTAVKRAVELTCPFQKKPCTRSCAIAVPVGHSWYCAFTDGKRIVEPPEY